MKLNKTIEINIEINVS